MDHDYIRTRWDLEVDQEDIVKHVAGFIVYKVSKRINCRTCCEQLHGELEYQSSLTRIKNSKNLTIPSSDVCKICVLLEKSIRANIDEINNTKFHCIILHKLYQKPFFNNQIMNEHDLEFGMFESHQRRLIKMIVDLYIKIRIYHVNNLNKLTPKKRNKLKKLILFANE